MEISNTEGCICQTILITHQHWQAYEMVTRLWGTVNNLMGQCHLWWVIIYSFSYTLKLEAVHRGLHSTELKHIGSSLGVRVTMSCNFVAPKFYLET